MFPTDDSKDPEYGCWIDYGEIFKGKDGVSYRNLTLQPNLNAKNKVFKDLAGGGHTKLGILAVPVDDKIRGDMDAEDALCAIGQGG